MTATPNTKPRSCVVCGERGSDGVAVQRAITTRTGSAGTITRRVCGRCCGVVAGFVMDAAFRGAG